MASFTKEDEQNAYAQASIPSINSGDNIATLPVVPDVEARSQEIKSFDSKDVLMPTLPPPDDPTLQSDAKGRVYDPRLPGGYVYSDGSPADLGDTESTPQERSQINAAKASGNSSDPFAQFISENTSPPSSTSSSQIDNKDPFAQFVDSQAVANAKQENRQRQQKEASQQQSFGASFMNGVDVFNRQFARIAESGLQLGAKGLDATLGTNLQQPIRDLRNQNEAVVNRAFYESPVASTVGGIAGGIGSAISLGSGATGLIGSTLGRIGATSAMSAALAGLQSTKDTATGRLQDMAIGAAAGGLGQGLVEGVGPLSKYAVSKLVKEPAEETLQLMKSGEVMSAGMATGSPLLKSVESRLAATPSIKLGERGINLGMSGFADDVAKEAQNRLGKYGASISQLGLSDDQVSILNSSLINKSGLDAEEFMDAALLANRPSLVKETFKKLNPQESEYMSNMIMNNALKRNFNPSTNSIDINGFKSTLDHINSTIGSFPDSQKTVIQGLQKFLNRGDHLISAITKEAEASGTALTGVGGFASYATGGIEGLAAYMGGTKLISTLLTNQSFVKQLVKLGVVKSGTEAEKETLSQLARGIVKKALITSAASGFATTSPDLAQ